MKKLLAVCLAVVLCVSCLTISAGAAVAGHVYRFGDINADGRLTIDDVTDTQRYLAEMVTWHYGLRYRADYNHDDRVSVKDVTEIQRAIAELPQSPDYGGTYLVGNSLVDDVHSNYLSGTMPAGTPVTFSVRSYRGESFVFCVDDAVVQPRSTSKTCTYTFYEPGYHSVTVYGSIDTGSRELHSYNVSYYVPETVSETELRINCLWGQHEWDGQHYTYFAEFGATGGTGPYTYEVTMINLDPEIYDTTITIDSGGVYDWYTDIERYTDYCQTHETDWQLRYNDRLERYEFYRDFSAEDTICIDREMLDFENCCYDLVVQAKDAQGAVSNRKTLTILSLYRA